MLEPKSAIKDAQPAYGIGIHFGIFNCEKSLGVML
jgi:hypothetical protein